MRETVRNVTLGILAGAAAIESSSLAELQVPAISQTTDRDLSVEQDPDRQSDPKTLDEAKTAIQQLQKRIVALTEGKGEPEGQKLREDLSAAYTALLAEHQELQRQILSDRDRQRAWMESSDPGAAWIRSHEGLTNDEATALLYVLNVELNIGDSEILFSQALSRQLSEKAIAMHVHKLDDELTKSGVSEKKRDALCDMYGERLAAWKVYLERSGREDKNSGPAPEVPPHLDPKVLAWARDHVKQYEPVLKAFVPEGELLAELRAQQSIVHFTYIWRDSRAAQDIFAQGD